MENLTKEKALELHRQMWTDMRSDLGNNPTGGERVDYKIDWCKTHFPDESIENSCFLCEYNKNKGKFCSSCPVKWPIEIKGYNYCTDNDYYYKAPISEILALPEREVEE